MSWKSYYEKHLMTAQQAVSLIQSGDVISVGHAVGEPTALLNALVADAERLHDVELLHMVLMGKGEYLAESMEGHFRHNSLFVGGAAAKRSSRAARISPHAISIASRSCCARRTARTWQ